MRNSAALHMVPAEAISSSMRIAVFPFTFPTMPCVCGVSVSSYLRLSMTAMGRLRMSVNGARSLTSPTSGLTSTALVRLRVLR